MQSAAVLRNRTVRYVLSRLGYAAASAFFVAAVVFFSLRATAGDQALAILGTTSTPTQRVQLRHVIGLDRPVLSQFASWLGNLLTGNFGYSYSQGRPVSAVIAPALRNTLLLGAASTVLTVAIGLAMGNLASSNSRALRRITDAFEVVFLSAPQYTVALILLLFLAVRFQVFPSGGLHSLSGGGQADLAEHLVLPSVSLALAPGAYLARALKTSKIELQTTELLPAIRLRGLSLWRVSLHIHHNALPPMVTQFGIQLGTIFGGALFVENIYSIPGLGQLTLQAIEGRDFTVVEATSFLLAAMFVGLLLVADLANLALDPRSRESRS